MARWLATEKNVWRTREWHHTSSQYNMTDFYDPYVLASEIRAMSPDLLRQYKQEYREWSAAKKSEPAKRVAGTYTEWVGKFANHRKPVEHEFTGWLKKGWVHIDGGGRKKADTRNVTFKEVSEAEADAMVAARRKAEEESMARIRIHADIPSSPKPKRLSHMSDAEADDHERLRRSLLVMLDVLNSHRRQAGMKPYTKQNFAKGRSSMRPHELEGWLVRGYDELARLRREFEPTKSDTPWFKQAADYGITSDPLYKQSESEVTDDDATILLDRKLETLTEAVNFYRNLDAQTPWDWRDIARDESSRADKNRALLEGYVELTDAEKRWAEQDVWWQGRMAVLRNDPLYQSARRDAEQKHEFDHLPSFGSSPVRDAKVRAPSKHQSGFSAAREVSDALPTGVSLRQSGYSGRY